MPQVVDARVPYEKGCNSTNIDTVSLVERHCVTATNWKSTLHQASHWLKPISTQNLVV